MTSQQDDIKRAVERLRKLQAMAEGAAKVGNEQEAEAFAQGVQKLLGKYKLDMSVLEQEEQDQLDPLGHAVFDFADTAVGRKRRRIGWTETITRKVARAHFCETLPIFGTNAINIIGRKADVQVAIYMSMMLIRIGKEGADKAYRKERYHKWKQDRMEEAHGFRSAFLMGYTERLGERLEAMHVEEVASDGRFALIVKKGAAEIAKYKEDTFKIKKSRGPQINASGHRDAINRGMDAGRRAADEANLNVRGVGGGSTTRARELGQPQKRLGRGE